MKPIKIIVPLLILIIIQYFYFENKLENAQKQTAEFSKPSTESTKTTLQLPAFSDLAEQAKQSVVSIEVSSGETRRRVDGMGSGFVISEDGYLLTNNHVTDGARDIVVKLADGSEHNAELVGSDADTDLSLLKIDVAGLKPFEFGNVENTKVGSWVVAIGAPFGFEQTVTAGIVSAKGRSVGEQYVPYIQTDVAINVGNSGGPLINMDGKVIGINSKIVSTFGGSLGLSFAIPIDLAVDVVNQLKTNGKVKRGFLGVGYQEVTREIAESFSLKRNRGALINGVSRNSPADKGGLRVGDIVTAVDGKKIINYTELPFLIGRLRPGMETELSIIRDGEHETLKLIIGSRDPQERVTYEQPVLEPEQEDNPLKIRVSDVPDDVKQALNLNEGILVEEVEEGPASQSGLRRGDIIISIQTTPMNSVSDFNNIMENLPQSRTFAVLITRPGQGTRYIVVDLDG
ncbi:Do family serine endopeptidase [Aliikangiella coralliicola]|uniref:Probable periplasmic serine endoprotease DegP-like n=1 Tax=Aliikangiella coralliicola TaxID=2592383 RepID=A0A545U692_9GAMM|nr:Do family serine endopeptidase [Aliikangiella coralliicola]TQV84989.1 Do family serine endopeptidase [Aliikangiella coralliicola]